MNHSTSSNVPCFCLRITSKRCSEWCWVTEPCHRRQEESVWLSPLQCTAIPCCLRVPVRPGRRCLRGATFDISGVWIFSQSVHVLHVIVLWLRESIFDWKCVTAWRVILDSLLIHIWNCVFFFTCLLPLLPSSLLPYARFQEYSLRVMNYTVNHCTTIINKPIKLIKKMISLVLLHRGKQTNLIENCLWWKFMKR